LPYIPQAFSNLSNGGKKKSGSGGGGSIGGVAAGGSGGIIAAIIVGGLVVLGAVWHFVRRINAPAPPATSAALPVVPSNN